MENSHEANDPPFVILTIGGKNVEPDCLSTDGGARFMETHGEIRFQRSGVSGPCRMMNISAMCGVCSLGIAVVAVSLGQMLVINVQASFEAR